MEIDPVWQRRDLGQVLPASRAGNGSESCSKSGGLKPSSAKGFYGGVMGAYQKNGRAVMQLVPGSTRDDFTTTDESGGSSPCDTTDFWHEWIQSFSKVGSGPDGEVDPLTAFVSLSRREQRAGKLIVTVSNTTFAPRGTSLTVDPNCDASPATCRQTFEWAGHVTFTKTKSPGAR